MSNIRKIYREIAGPDKEFDILWKMLILKN
jgi:hypothetical protein